MRSPSVVLALILASGTMAAHAQTAGTGWPNWRGPNGSGVAPDQRLPTRWSAAENVAWKVAIAGAGDVNATRTVWRVATDAPYVSSLLYYDGIVYMANDVGVLTAVDAATGERMWQERVEGVFSASPVGGGGHVYFVAESGDTVVVKAGKTPQIVARNALGERTVASPAIAKGQIFVRTDRHLFSIGR
jgi:outer membrane protein assembly factor BamB